MYALKKIPRNVFSILMSLEPVIATIVGILLLNENLTEKQYAAILFIVAASLGSTLTIKRKAEMLLNE
jgi:inner membrane transporter RhtA